MPDVDTGTVRWHDWANHNGRRDMEFTDKEILALKLLVLGKSRAQVADAFGMTGTTFARFMRRVYMEAGTAGTLETAVKLSLSGHLGLTLSDFPYRVQVSGPATPQRRV